MSEQGSKEWLAERLGKVTGSRISDLMAKTQSGPSTSRANYMAQLLVERMTGMPVESYKNAAMQWGTEQEPSARAAYEFMTNNKVELVGFVNHPLIAMSGASPDGLIGDDGLVEIKCPITATHIATLKSGNVPLQYNLQMQWQMACTDRQWCDYVSFDPRMPESMSLFIKRVERDDDKISGIASEVVNFLVELDETVRTLRKTYEPNFTMEQGE